MAKRLPSIDLQEALRTAGDSIQGAACVIANNAEHFASRAADVAEKAGKTIGKTANDAICAASEGIDKAREVAEEKKLMNFQSLDSLQPVVNVVNDASAALDDANRTIHESAIPEVVGGALGAAAGGIGSFAALYGLGTVGLSAAGMTSALATAGAGVGGGMAAGVFVWAVPVAVAAGVGVGVASNLRAKQLQQEKERLYKEALRKHQAIIQALKDEADASKERLDYLQSLNLLLGRAIKDLQKDLGIVSWTAMNTRMKRGRSTSSWPAKMRN